MQSVNIQSAQQARRAGSVDVSCARDVFSFNSQLSKHNVHKSRLHKEKCHVYKSENRLDRYGLIRMYFMITEQISMASGTALL